ncbi:MAG: hypothetical protein BIFFINMI_03781 [Phycisphaerae bacterium]|nr:hypothetical protein [Phycisphaerae bacterium]
MVGPASSPRVSVISTGKSCPTARVSLPVSGVISIWLGQCALVIGHSSRENPVRAQAGWNVSTAIRPTAARMPASMPRLVALSDRTLANGTLPLVWPACLTTSRISAAETPSCRSGLVMKFTVEASWSFSSGKRASSLRATSSSEMRARMGR